MSRKPSVPPQASPSADPLITAVTLQQQGRVAEAELLFRQVLAQMPTHAAALYSLAVIVLNARRPDEALRLAQAGTTANRDFAPLWFIQGAALQALHRREEALASYDRALELDPKYVEVLVNSGALLHDLRQHKESLARFHRVLEINPDHETALGNYGILLTEFKLGPQAVVAFERLLRNNPDYPFGLGLLCYERMHHCDWTDLDATVARITEGLRAGRRTCKTLGYMALSDNASDHFQCAQVFATDYTKGFRAAQPAPLWRGEVYQHPRKRIAYVSPDLREHPVGHLMAGVIEGHDKAKVELIAISLGIDDHSRIRARMLDAFDHFIDAKDMTARQIAELMRRMEVDIAIDLAGYTTDSRTEVFLHRPAPIQINYLGYPGTLGLDCYDYILADRTVIPEDHAAFYTEKPAYLPHCYLPVASGIEVAEPLARSAYGLPRRGFVFCAFSHDYKIHPDLFSIWMRLLEANPGSVLWLMSRNEVSQHNLRREAQARGVDPDRLVFATRVPYVEDHLARYRVANLFLDTWPYNAHTTAADALLAGLPVVTYQGGAFPARVASSLLTTLGLDELIAPSLEAYFELANSLAQHPRRLQKFKKRLSPEALKDHPFLGASFTRALEAVLDTLEPAVPLAPQGEATPEPPAPVDPTPDADFLAARELLRQGNLPQAELRARRSLAARPQGPAQALLHELRQAYGLPEGFELSERSPAPRDPRFLVIKAWGYGFWSEGHHLASQLLLAELTHRTPIVLWGSNCLFRRGDEADASAHFFQGLSGATLADLPAGASIYPPKWTRDNLLVDDVHKWEGEGSRLAAPYLFARPETVVVSDFYTTLSALRPWIGPTSAYYGKDDDTLYAELFQKHLKPTPAIAERAEAFFTRHMEGRPWVAVHARGSDKVHESPHLAATNASYFGFVDRIVELNPTIGVFLLTDATPLIEAFRARYGDRLLCTQVTRTDTHQGVHLSGHDGVALGEEVFVDTLLATRCDYFIGNRESNVSLAIASLRAWPQGFLFLLGGPDIRGENPFLHQRNPRPNPPCRLCGAATESAFTRPLRGTPVSFLRCGGCGSLQASPQGAPDPGLDAGHAARAFAQAGLLHRLFEALDLRPGDPCAALGEDSGLLTRLLRDLGWNAFRLGPAAPGNLARGFAWEALDRPLKAAILLGGFDPDAAATWRALFATGADFIVGLTPLYTGQDPEWPALDAHPGSFLLSPGALGQLATQQGWQAYRVGEAWLLSRAALPDATGAALGACLQEAPEGVLRRWLASAPANAAADDAHVARLEALRRAGVRIALDGVFFRFASGIARVWRSLLAQWSANGFGEFITVLDRGRTAPRFAGLRYVDVPLHDVTRRSEDRALLQEACDREGLTFFLSTYYTTPLTTPAALMVHDMIPEVLGFDLGEAQWQEKHEALRTCGDYLAVSQSTARDLVRLCPEITPGQVVIATCGTDFRPPSAEAVSAFKARHGIGRPYFLLSGVANDYKNAGLFFRAFRELGDARASYAIVCTHSRGPLAPDLEACVGGAQVHHLVLSDEDLQAAYAGALALVYPSRYEGFGLPVLEAMACGCPVITCANSSLVEVAGDAALVVSPDDVQGLRVGLEQVQRPEVRALLITRGLARAPQFAWRDMADRVAEAVTRWALARRG